MSVPNYESVVRAANEVLGGAISRGPDGAFSVVNLAAVQIRKSGDLTCGVLEKTGGNRSRDRAVDILAFRQGDGTLQLVDCIVASGDPDARVAWQMSDVLPDQSRWREPYPVDGGGEQPHDPPPPPVDLSGIVTRLDALDGQIRLLASCLDVLRGLLGAIRADTQITANQAPKLEPVLQGVAQMTAQLQRGFDVALSVPYIGTAKGAVMPRK